MAFQMLNARLARSHASRTHRSSPHRPDRTPSAGRSRWRALGPVCRTEDSAGPCRTGAGDRAASSSSDNGAAEFDRASKAIVTSYERSYNERDKVESPGSPRS
jgi:hypothetical protein